MIWFISWIMMACSDCCLSPSSAYFVSSIPLKISPACMMCRSTASFNSSLSVLTITSTTFPNIVWRVSLSLNSLSTWVKEWVPGR